MILLTGASGFIGTHFLQKAAGLFSFRCVLREFSVMGVENDARLEIFRGNLLDRNFLDKATQGVDTVLHMAALIRNHTPKEVMRVNLEGTRLLLQAAEKNAVKRFIFVSSENALREDLSDAYAVSKRGAEELVRTFPDHLILRPCFVFGAGDDHGLGRLLALALASPILPLFGGLKSQIQPVSIGDMTEVLVRALRSDVRGEYLIAGLDKINLNEFLKRCWHLKNKRPLYLIVPSFVVRALLGRTRFLNIYNSRTYSIEKTIRDFQVTPRPLDVGLRAWLNA